MRAIAACSALTDRYPVRRCRQTAIGEKISAGAQRLKQWAKNVTRDVHAVYLASRDPRVPWYVKALAIAVAGYALSPIDLIPDFIPVVGYLDDAIILPLGILLVVKLIPPEIMAEHRAAATLAHERPTSGMGAAVIVIIWIATTVILGLLVYRYFSN